MTEGKRAELALNAKKKMQDLLRDERAKKRSSLAPSSMTVQEKK